MQLCQVIWCRSLNLLVARWQWSSLAWSGGLIFVVESRSGQVRLKPCCNVSVARYERWPHFMQLFSIKCFCSALHHRDFQNLMKITWSHVETTSHLGLWNALTFNISIFMFRGTLWLVFSVVEITPEDAGRKPSDRIVDSQAEHKMYKLSPLRISKWRETRFKSSNFVLTFYLLNISDDGFDEHNFFLPLLQDSPWINIKHKVCLPLSWRSLSRSGRELEFYERFDNEF